VYSLPQKLKGVQRNLHVKHGQPEALVLLGPHAVREKPDLQGLRVRQIGLE